MRNLDIYGWVALIIVLIGGICWGLVGLFDVFLVTSIFGNLLARLIYIVVGVAAGYLCYLMYLEKNQESGIKHKSVLSQFLGHSCGLVFFPSLERKYNKSSKNDTT